MGYPKSTYNQEEINDFAGNHPMTDMSNKFLLKQVYDNTKQVMDAFHNFVAQMQARDEQKDRLIELLQYQKEQEWTDMQRVSVPDLMSFFKVSRNTIEGLEEKGIFIRSSLLSGQKHSYFIWKQVKEAVLQDIEAQQTLYKKARRNTPTH